MSKAAIVFLLITVTGAGQVHHENFNSKHACEEARSLSLYGETVESYAAKEKSIADYEKKRVVDYQKQVGEFKKIHPPRDPKNKEEKEWVENAKSLRKNGTGFFGSCPELSIEVTADYKVQDLPPHPWPCMTWGVSYRPSEGEWSDFVHGHAVLREKNDVKTAECIKSVP